MTTLCATPYNLDSTFWYFESAEEFEEKFANNLPTEEYEIQYIDGHNSSLFSQASIDQSSINTWFDELDHIDDDSENGLGISYLLGLGYTLSDAIERADEVLLHKGKISDYVFDFFNEINEIPSNLAGYIDYDKIQRDMEIEGEIVELKSGIYVTNSNEF